MNLQKDRQKKIVLLVLLSLVLLYVIGWLIYWCGLHKIYRINDNIFIYHENNYVYAEECQYQYYSGKRIIISRYYGIHRKKFYRSNERENPKSIIYYTNSVIIDPYLYFREDIDYKNIEMLFYLYSDSELRIITHLGNCTFNDLIEENVDLDIEDWKQYSQFKMRLNSIENDVYYYIELYLIKKEQYYLVVKCHNNDVKYYCPSSYFFDVCDYLIN